MDERSLPVLNVKDVGRILGEYRPLPKDPDKEPNTSPLAPKSVSQYLVESKPGGRFADHPFPTPAGRIGQWPYWLPEQEREIREWAARRPGAGARTDLPRKKPQ